MNTEIRIAVETRDAYGDVIPDIECTWEATMQDIKAKTSLASYLGDGNAKVSVSLSEKIGGPRYSSTSVMVTVSLACNQDHDTVDKAAKAAHVHAVSLLDSFLEDALPLMHAHIEKAEQVEERRRG